MPGLITHYICGEAILAELNSDREEVILKNRQLYNVGTQGPDIFFYYYPGLIKKRLMNLGSKMHNNNFSKFMDNILSNVDSLDNEKKNAFISYISGYLSHYCLDYSTHPYIYYKTGFRKSNNVKELKYSVYHRKFETAIDVLMLKLVSGEKPSDKKLWQLIHITKNESDIISDILSNAISSVYDVPITSKEIFKAMSYMSYTTRLLQSTRGKRKRLMEFAENMTIGEKIVSSLIHLQKIDDGLDYLNLKKNVWHMPWDNKNDKQCTFTDMFNLAVEDSTKMINCLFDYCENKVSKEEALACFGNYAFTGAEPDRKMEFKFSNIIFE